MGRGCRCAGQERSLLDILQEKKSRSLPVGKGGRERKKREKRAPVGEK